MPMAGTLGFQICTASETERSQAEVVSSRDLGSLWERSNHVGDHSTNVVGKVTLEQVPTERRRPHWGWRTRSVCRVLKRVTRTGKPQMERNADRTKTLSQPPLAGTLWVCAKTPFSIMYGLLHKIVS